MPTNVTTTNNGPFIDEQLSELIVTSIADDIVVEQDNETTIIAAGKQGPAGPQSNLSSPLTITGNGSYVGDWGYSTLILQDNAGYAGINFRNGSSNWLYRMEAGGSEMKWAYSSNASSQGVGSYTEYLRLNTDYLYHTSDMRTPIFYDSDNTGYYCDPNGTTNLNTLYAIFPTLFQSSTQATTSTDRSLGYSTSWTNHLSVAFTDRKSTRLNSSH